MARRVETETERHLEAFGVYVELGEGRSFAAVARKLGVSQTSIEKWARSFDWRRRADEHDAKAARRTIDVVEDHAAATDDAKAKARNLQLVRMALLKLAQALASGNVRFNAADLSRLVQLEQLITEDDARIRADGEREDLSGLTAEKLWADICAEIEAINRLAAHDDELRLLLAEGRIQDLPAIAASFPDPIAPAALPDLSGASDDGRALAAVAVPFDDDGRPEYAK